MLTTKLYRYKFYPWSNQLDITVFEAKEKKNSYVISKAQKPIEKIKIKKCEIGILDSGTNTMYLTEENSNLFIAALIRNKEQALKRLNQAINRESRVLDMLRDMLLL